MSERKILGRDAILAAKRKTVEVDCPELGGSILIRELSVSQARHIDTEDVAKQLAMMIVDEEGNLLFGDEDGIKALGELGANTVIRLMTAAAKLNGIGQAAVDEVVKNLLASPNVNSESA